MKQPLILLLCVALVVLVGQASQADAEQTHAIHEKVSTKTIPRPTIITIPSPELLTDWTSPEIYRELGIEIIEIPPPKYSQGDLDILARMIYAEARGECEEGKYAVACVAMNRLEAGYGSTLKKVITAKNQFAYGLRTNEECTRIAKEVLEGKRTIPKDVFYFRRSRSKKWRNFEYWKRIGNHSFYRKGG